MAENVEGAKALRDRLSSAVKRIPAELARALYQEALVESKESMRRTPVDTGALRASHMVEEPVITEGDVSARIVVGGSAAPYALAVHENLEAEHHVGQAKFLESTLNESKPFMLARLAKRIDLNRVIGG